MVIIQTEFIYLTPEVQFKNKKDVKFHHQKNWQGICYRQSISIF